MAFLSPSSAVPLRRRCARPYSRPRPFLCSATPPPAHATPATAPTLQSFIASCDALGTLRFIATTRGMALETIGRLDYAARTISTPTRRLLSLSAPDRTFELHLDPALVAAVTLHTEPAKMDPDASLHLLRFRDADDNILLSVCLMWDPAQGPGHYLYGAVPAFESLRQRVGDRVTFAEMTQP